MTVKTQINSIQEITMEAEGTTEQCMRTLGAIIAFDGKCGCCKSGKVQLGFKEVGKAEKYQYYEFICLDCGARAQWGEYRSKGFFLKKWEKFDKNNQGYDIPSSPRNTPDSYPDQDYGPPASDKDIPY